MNKTIVPGFTLYACVGPWARPHFLRGELTGHLVLGWFAIGWLKFDVEGTLGNLSQRMIDAEQLLGELGYE